MDSNLTDRLDSLYRAYDDYMEEAEKLREFIRRYTHEVSDGGRFTPEGRQQIGHIVIIITALLNLAAAVYRDIELICEPSARVSFDVATGRIELENCEYGPQISEEVGRFLESERLKYEERLARAGKPKTA